jgi:uncharacterized protein (TIGR03435 family)
MLKNQHQPFVPLRRSQTYKSAGQALQFVLLMRMVTGVLSSQSTSPDRLTFEVASVKPTNSVSGRFTMNGGPGTTDPGRISYTNIMLRRILLNAYDVKNYQLSGPEWLDTLRFDITAKIPEGATKEQFQLMLRKLLEDRFKMTTHRESKELPIYALVVAKNGPKIKAAAEDVASEKSDEQQLAVAQPGEGKDGFPALSLRAPALVIETKNGRARVTAKEIPMTKFADLLTGQVGRPVVDMTGLNGDYSFAVYFTPEGPNSGDASEPSIFGALQERLGLKLEARKGPVELLVIDHAEKVPTEN